MWYHGHMRNLSRADRDRHRGIGARCPTREDYLPYCDPCTQPLCGCVAPPADCPPIDCSGEPSIPVDPRARVRAFQRGYADAEVEQEYGPGCETIWTYQADRCPPGTRQVGWYPAIDGEDLAMVCCPAQGIGGCRVEYDTERGVKRTWCPDGTVTIDLYRLNELLDRAGWGYHVLRPY